MPTAKKGTGYLTGDAGGSKPMAKVARCTTINREGGRSRMGSWTAGAGLELPGRRAIQWVLCFGSVGGDDVSTATHGMYQAWPGGVKFELLA